jgi:hypothetical protein
MDSKHVSDHYLELYYLDKVTEIVELASLEGHLLECRFCADRAHTIEDYLDALRSVIAGGAHSTKWPTQVSEPGIVGKLQSLNDTGVLRRRESILGKVSARLPSLKFVWALKHLLARAALPASKGREANS